MDQKPIKENGIIKSIFVSVFVGLVLVSLLGYKIYQGYKADLILRQQRLQEAQRQGDQVRESLKPVKIQDLPVDKTEFQGKG